MNSHLNKLQKMNIMNNVLKWLQILLIIIYAIFMSWISIQLNAIHHKYIIIISTAIILGITIFFAIIYFYMWYLIKNNKNKQLILIEIFIKYIFSNINTEYFVDVEKPTQKRLNLVENSDFFSVQMVKGTYKFVFRIKYKISYQKSPTQYLIHKDNNDSFIVKEINEIDMTWITSVSNKKILFKKDKLFQNMIFLVNLCEWYINNKSGKY